MKGLSSNSQNFKKDGIEFNISAPGKVILHGEHSVVYGKLAIAASLGLRTKIHLMEIDSSNKLILKILPSDFEFAFNLNEIQELLLDKPPIIITENISDFNWESPKLVDHQAHYQIVEKAVASFFTDKTNYPDIHVIKATSSLFYLLSGILSSVDLSLKPLCITIDSELSMGAGTGSSASLSVAFAALLIHYIKLKSKTFENISKKGLKPFLFKNGDFSDTHFNERELEAISEWSYCSEKIFHGTPSGLDNTICTYGNLVKFRMNHSPEQLTIKTPINLLLINSKVPRETMKMVRHVADLKRLFPNVVDNILDALDNLTRNALEIIENIDKASAAGDNEELNKNFQLWETLIQMNHSLLSSLELSHRKLEEIVMLLDKNGLKGKLTGGGGGGYSISVLPPSYDPEEVIRILKEHEFEVIATKLGGPGVKVD